MEIINYDEIKGSKYKYRLQNFKLLAIPTFDFSFIFYTNINSTHKLLSRPVSTSDSENCIRNIDIVAYQIFRYRSFKF